MSESISALWKLAAACGIQPAYTSAAGKRVRARPQSLLAAIRSYGGAIDTMNDARAALRQLKQHRHSRKLPPVLVIWGDRERAIHLASPSVTSPRSCHLTLEHGEQMQCHIQQQGNGCTVLFPRELPFGYHQLQVQGGESDSTAHVFVAPQRAYQASTNGRRWGAFIPLYALHSQRSWGIGDLTDLHDLRQCVGQHGGAFVGTLPILASASADDASQSPYMPGTRQFFSELYLDIEAVPEFGACEEAQRIVSSSSFRNALDEARRSALVDYAKVRDLRRRVLRPMADALFARESQRRTQLQQHVRNDNELQLYAAFQAEQQRRGRTWRHWPASQRDGQLQQHAGDDQVRQYHLYVQWLLRQQLESNDGTSTFLYLDLPVGVHPDGFDAWRQRSCSVQGVHIGAPPDGFFPDGQDWGMVPVHPYHSRVDGHQQFRAAVRANCEVAGLLRIDHVMSLHRLYWVPEGASPAEGVYVRYPAEELYAILCIESHRAGCGIVGENLGTVAPVVDRTMKRRGIAPMFVAQFSLTGDSDQPLEDPPAGSMASLNTHDIPTFAAYWHGNDLAYRLAMGQLTAVQARREAKTRSEMRRSLHGAAGETTDEEARRALLELLVMLIKSQAAYVLLNLEDIWQERHSQNVPGTINETNWRRKSRYSLQQIMASGDALEVLKALNCNARSRDG